MFIDALHKLVDIYLFNALITLIIHLYYLIMAYEVIMLEKLASVQVKGQKWITSNIFHSVTLYPYFVHRHD